MKKRLLSAVLALAMALTLLPMSLIAPSFAAAASASAPESGKTSVQYVHGSDFSKVTEDKAVIKDEWTWQYKAADGKTYWAHGGTSLTGIVTGTNASGTYYAADLSDFTNTNGTLKSTSFTLVGDLTLSIAPLAANNVSGSLSVNLFGKNLTIGNNVLNRYNGLTITDTWYSNGWGTRGTVSGIARDVGTYNSTIDRTTMSASGLTLNVTGANITGPVNLVGRGNTVTLTDVSITGGITLNGTTSVTTTSGTTTTHPGQRLTINAKATAPYSKSTVGDDIAITGDNSTIAINGTTATSHAVNVTGTRGTLTLSNDTSVGAITVVPGTDGNSPTTNAPASVTINDATAASYTYTSPANNTALSSLIVNAQGKVSGAISTTNGTVALHSANVDAVTVEAGTLTIDGTTGSVGNITLGRNSGTTASKVTLNFSGTNYMVGDITKAHEDTVLTIGNSWPASRTNTFGEVDLKNYTGQMIKGGIFKTAADDSGKAAWFSSDLQFYRNMAIGTNDKFSYYGKRELSTAIADAGAQAKIDGAIAVIGWKGTGNGSNLKYAKFFNSLVDSNDPENAVASLAYGVSTAIYLPDKINGSPVATWTDASTVNTPGTGTAKTYGVNELVSLSVNSSGIQLVLQSTGAAVSKLTNATISGNNKDVTVALNGNQITLSGAVGQAGIEDVTVTCTTDLMGTTGTYVTFDVNVSFDTATKVATISTLGITPPPQGVTINTNNNTIQVGDNTYTLSVSGLTKPASDLEVAGFTGSSYAYTGADITGTGIVATVNVPGMGNASKLELSNKIAGTGAAFTWVNSPAMRQSVNQAMTTITNNNQIQNWATAAQRAAWSKLNRGKTPSETDLLGTGYTTVVVEPYLAMTVTQYNDSGTMTANLVPSYRVIVVSSENDYVEACKNQSGFTAEGYYIAQQGRALPTLINNLTGSATGDVGVTLKFSDAGLGANFTNAYMHQDSTYVYPISTDTYTLTHAGKTGLGTIVLNSTPHSVEMLRKTGAIDQNGVKLNADRTAYYDSLQAAVDDTLPQLMDRLDKITVKSNYTGNGTISVTGEARTFDVVTEGNTTIGSNANSDLVKVTGTGHEFTVQLLKGNVTTASIVVNSDPNNNGTAAITSNNVNAKPGEKVTVTLTPKQGYTGTITAKTNSGAAVAVTNNGNNTFTFTVPANATRVDVTPVFTLASALPFTDVATNAGYYNAVKYCYEKNMIQGTTNTTFSPNSTITRAQILTILWRQAGAQTQTPAGLYKDMPGNSDYYNAVIWATRNNIAQGYEDGRFYPDRPINRQELATFLYRYQVNFKRGTTAGSVNNLNSYTDGSQVGVWALPAMRWAVGNGIVSASGNRLSPKDAAPRWQAATAMYMYCSGVLGIV